MALLGMKKKQPFGQQFDPLSNGPFGTPGIGDGINQQMGAPVQGMGQMADITNLPAMAQQPMQADAPAKFKPNLLGVIGDAMQVFGGGQATYMNGVREQQQRAELMRERAMQAQQERETGWQDWVAKEEWKKKNEVQEPTAMERNLEAYSKWTPAQRQLYREMKPEYRQGPDGKFYRIDTQQGPAPTFTDDDWNNGQPIGGSGGDTTGGFPY